MSDEGKTAYLLISFDIKAQRMLSTEELAGPPAGKHTKVEVNWVRLLTTIKAKDTGPPQIGPPWTRGVVDEDYRPPLWNRTDEDDSGGGEEKPPEV